MYSFSNKTFAPALVNANGTLVCAMCRAAAGKSWGYIEIVSTHSNDGGKSWSKPSVAAAPPARTVTSDLSNTKSAFFLNPVLATAPNGDIIMLTTFFPESKGTAQPKYLEKKKAAFTYFDGERCPVIYDRDGNYYIIMENGRVIDRSKAKTAFSVQGIGELYREGEYIGNIYLNGAKGKSEGEEKTTFGSQLKTPKRSYIFMQKSTDGGETWSAPKDITPHIFNEPDGAVVMTASGAGITTESGRIIMPLYSDKGAFSVYSDDGGNTWNRNPRMPYLGGKGSWCAIQTPDGQLHAFSEGKTAASDDNGILWLKGEKLPTSIAKGLKSACICANHIFISARTAKQDGRLEIADFITDKKGAYKGFKWRKETTEICQNGFGASCLAPLDKATLALTYEDGDKVSFNVISVE